jgi:cell division protein FtsQ
VIAERRRRTRSRRRLHLPSWLFDRRVAAVLVAAVILLGGGWLWFRSSSFVAVHQVRVTGLSGPNVSQITRALTTTAETMTTLDFDVSKLKRSVEAYPYVHSLDVSTDFPHGVTIDVLEEVPVAVTSVAGRVTVVDATGSLLSSGGTPHGALPSVPLGSVSTGGAETGSAETGAASGRLTAPGSLAALKVLVAAPYRFLPHVASAVSSSAHGVVVKLRGGPSLYFGPLVELSDKWNAALAVLAARGSAAAAGGEYIDVSDPQRPAVGAQSPTQPSG